MKNILISGGSGFIGRNLMEGLRFKYGVFAPQHNELDMLDYGALKRYVVGNKINGAEREYYNDMLMFLNLEKISTIVEKILYFGSGAEFDKRFDICEVTENDFGKSIPDSEYGLGKYTMTKLTRTSSNIYNLRLFGIFGKYELWNVKFISNLCCKAVFSLPLSIRKDCRFNFLYIDDLVTVADWFIQHTPTYHDYNVCHDQNFMLSELAEMVIRVSGKDLDICMLSDGLDLEYTANNQRLHTEMSVFAPMQMEDSISSLYRFYEQNKALIDLDILKASR